MASPPSTPHRPGPRLAGLLLAFGAAQFLFCLTAAESLYPGYSVAKNYISDLGVGPVAWLFNGSVALLGLLSLASAYLLWKSSREPFLGAAMALSGLGAMGVGLFPETAGPIHVVVSFITFFFGGVAALLTFRLGLGRAESILSALLGVLSLTALYLFATHTYFGLGPGGMERLIAYPLLIWAHGLGAHLLAIAKTDAAPGSR